MKASHWILLAAMAAGMVKGVPSKDKTDEVPSKPGIEDVQDDLDEKLYEPVPDNIATALDIARHVDILMLGEVHPRWYNEANNGEDNIYLDEEKFVAELLPYLKSLDYTKLYVESEANDIFQKYMSNPNEEEAEAEFRASFLQDKFKVELGEEGLVRKAYETEGHEWTWLKTLVEKRNEEIEDPNDYLTVEEGRKLLTDSYLGAIEEGLILAKAARKEGFEFVSYDDLSKRKEYTRRDSSDERQRGHAEVINEGTQEVDGVVQKGVVLMGKNWIRDNILTSFRILRDEYKRSIGRLELCIDDDSEFEPEDNIPSVYLN